MDTGPVYRAVCLIYIPAVKPVPNYTAWWQRHMRVNNLSKVVTWQCPGAKSNLRLWVTSGLQVRHITVRLLSHTHFCIPQKNGIKFYPMTHYSQNSTEQNKQVNIENWKTKRLDTAYCSKVRDVETPSPSTCIPWWAMFLLSSCNAIED